MTMKTKVKRRPVLVAGGLAATILAGATGLGITIAQTTPTAAAPAAVRYVDQNGQPVAAPGSGAATVVTTSPQTAASTAATGTKAAAAPARSYDGAKGDDNGD